MLFKRFLINSIFTVFCFLLTFSIYFYLTGPTLATHTPPAAYVSNGFCYNFVNPFIYVSWNSVPASGPPPNVDMHRITRTDGGLDITRPGLSGEYFDNNVVASQSYSYSLISHSTDLGGHWSNPTIISPPVNTFTCNPMTSQVQVSCNGITPYVHIRFGYPSQNLNQFGNTDLYHLQRTDGVVNANVNGFDSNDYFNGSGVSDEFYDDFNVTRNNTYTYRIWGHSSVATLDNDSTMGPAWSPSITTTSILIPNNSCPPSNPPAVTIASSCVGGAPSIQLNWTNTRPNVDNYAIWRTDNGVNGGVGNVTSYTDWSVLSNSTYGYYVYSHSSTGGPDESGHWGSPGWSPASNLASVPTPNCTAPTITITNNGCSGANGVARNPSSITMPLGQTNSPASPNPQDPVVTLSVTSNAPNTTQIYLYRVGASTFIASQNGSSLGYTDTRTTGVADYTDYAYYAISYSPLTGYSPPSAQVHPVHPDGTDHTLKCDTVEPVATIYQIERFATPDCFTPDSGDRPWSSVPQPVQTQAGDASSGVNGVSFGLSNVYSLAGPVINPAITSFTGNPTGSFWDFSLPDQQTILPGTGPGVAGALNKEYHLYTRSCDNVTDPFRNCSDFNNSASASSPVDFYYLQSCQGSWLQTVEGDVHSNTSILTPGGPTN